MSIATVITRGFAIGDIAGVATRGFLGGGAAVEAPDTHDGGDAVPRRRRNHQPLPSLAEVRRRLLSRTKRPVDEIEAAAAQIEALANRVEDEAPAPWVNPVPLAPRNDATKALVLLAQEARRIQQVLDHVRSVARQRALERYRESVRALEAAMRERQEAEEADEIVQIIAQIM